MFWEKEVNSHKKSHLTVSLQKRNRNPQAHLSQMSVKDEAHMLGRGTNSAPQGHQVTGRKEMISIVQDLLQPISARVHTGACAHTPSPPPNSDAFFF